MHGNHFFSEFLDILKNNFYPTNAYPTRNQSGFPRQYADPQQNRIFVATHGARIHDSDRRPAYVQGTLLN
jgi:hypothetical protein